jgi:carboxymethylenebutenolidase
MGIQQLIWAIERVMDSFNTAVYSTGDLDAALAVAAPDCVLENVPSGRGHDDLRRYLADDLLPHLPADLTLRRLSRTADQRRLVDEVMVGFTHDRELPWLLPGVEPTGRHAEVLAVSVVAFRHTSRLGTTESRITSLRSLWDQAGLLAQLQLDGCPAR